MEEYDEEKNMQQREIKLGIPSYITVESEEGSFIGEQNSLNLKKKIFVLKQMKTEKSGLRQIPHR